MGEQISCRELSWGWPRDLPNYPATPCFIAPLPEQYRTTIRGMVPSGREVIFPYTDSSALSDMKLFSRSQMQAAENAGRRERIACANTSWDLNVWHRPEWRHERRAILDDNFFWDEATFYRKEIGLWKSSDEVGIRLSSWCGLMLAASAEVICEIRDQNYALFSAVNFETRNMRCKRQWTIIMFIKPS